VTRLWYAAQRTPTPAPVESEPDPSLETLVRACEEAYGENSTGDAAPTRDRAGRAD
jgi:hypothetical protein